MFICVRHLTFTQTKSAAHSCKQLVNVLKQQVITAADRTHFVACQAGCKRCCRIPAQPKAANFLDSFESASVPMMRPHLVGSCVAGVGGSPGSRVLHVPSGAPSCGLLALEAVLRPCDAICRHLPGVLVTRPCAMHLKRLSTYRLGGLYLVVCEHDRCSGRLYVVFSP